MLPGLIFIHEMNSISLVKKGHSAFPFLFICLIIDLEFHVIQRNRVQPKNGPLESSPNASLGYYTF